MEVIEHILNRYVLRLAIRMPLMVLIPFLSLIVMEMG